MLHIHSFFQNKLQFIQGRTADKYQFHKTRRAGNCKETTTKQWHCKSWCHLMSNLKQSYPIFFMARTAHFLKDPSLCALCFPGVLVVLA